MGSATTVLLVQKAIRTRTKPQKHGLSKLLKADYKELDGRCTPVAAMKAYRADLISSLGGADMSTQDLTIIDLCAKDKLIVDSIDAYLLQAGLFSKRKKAAWPLLATRLQVADSLTRKLQALGLSKKESPGTFPQSTLTPIT